jgi:hypothetical protein
MFRLFFGCVLSRFREPSQQFRDFGSIVCFPKSEDQMIQGSLIVRIIVQRSSTLLHCESGLPGLQVKFGQYVACDEKRRLQSDCLLGRLDRLPKF